MFGSFNLAQADLFNNPPPIQLNGDSAFLNEFAISELGGGGGANFSTSLAGTDGDDVFSFDQAPFVIGQGGDDFILTGDGRTAGVGGDGNDVLALGGGDDIAHGDNGNDTLYGQAGNDILEGGNGDDVLNGGTGFDRLTGGAGSDVFEFDLPDLNANIGQNRITDFGADDFIRVDTNGIPVFNLNPFELSQVGGDAVAYFNGVEVAVLEGVNAASVSASQLQVENSTLPVLDPSAFMGPMLPDVEIG